TSFGWFPSSWIPFCKWLSQYLMAMALVGIGSQVSIQAFRKQGVAPLLIGLVAWQAVSISSLLLQHVLRI
ncbi:putative sulfate exporter family transporter, partial [Streptococcus sanguinis]|nr:putative sulfate exporter family transporter [Streptococcus sanguinis]